jgi:hypothetical protein
MDIFDNMHSPPSPSTGREGDIGRCYLRDETERKKARKCKRKRKHEERPTKKGK